MKHKMTVLAVLGIALLLSTSLAFANSAGVGEANGFSGAATLPRCAQVDIPIFLSNSSDMGAWGLPLVVTGANVDGVTASAAAMSTSYAIGGFPGTAGVLNFVGCLPSGSYPDFWTLHLTTSSDCQGQVVIDTAFFAPAGAFLALDCNACPIPNFGWNSGSWDLANEAPVCGVNTNESINFQGSINKVLDASSSSSCAVLTYALVDGGGLTGADITNGVFTYAGSCGDVGNHTVEFSVTDDCGDAINCFFDVEVTNSAPLCGNNSNENIYYQSDIPSKQLDASDPDGNAITFSLASVVPPFLSGTADVTASGDFSLLGVDCNDVGTHTVTFTVDDGCNSTDCSFDITVFQNAPICVNPSNETINWLEPLDVTLVGSDDGCPDPLSWTIISETPAPTNPGSITNVNHYELNPDCADVGNIITVVVEVSDGAKTAQCQFDVEVINPAPTITCPDDIPVAVLGDLVATAASGSDPYADPLTYSLISFTNLEDAGRIPHNAPVVNADGSISWQTESSDNNDDGLWEMCLLVDDGCGGTDQCCFTIDVLSYVLCVGGPGGPADSAIGILNGQIAEVYVTLTNGYAVGGFDLLLCYDLSGLSFLGAQSAGSVNNWEYFTYRHSANSNCSGGCPSGYLRLVAIADLDNGPANHPDDADFLLDGPIAKLNFQVTSDRNFIGQCLNIGFCTLDCGDNTFASKSGDTLFVPIGSDQSCVDYEKYVARDIIELCTGRICVQEPPDDRGDMNLNGLANEVGDAVLYTNYFIYGNSVWDPVWVDVQLLASDVNDDGIVLTVADLIYMIRIITGDEFAFPANPKLSPYAASGNVSYRVENNAMTVSTRSATDIGGGLFVFRYSGMGIGTPTLANADSGMKIRSSASNGELRVVVTPDFSAMARIPSGNNDIFSIPIEGNGRIELVETQLSDGFGALMSVSTANVPIPEAYALRQNYPNPFNAGTVIPFDLKNEGDWSLQVYNIAGQLVRSFAGSGMGEIQVSWDGLNTRGESASSGVYFYRVTSGDFTSSRKMTLLK